MKKLAFVADNEIFFIDDIFALTYREEYEQKALSNPTIINIDNYLGLPLGSFYENGNFYDKNDLQKTTPLENFPINPERDFWNGFAMVFNGEVFSTHYFNNMSPNHVPLIAGFSSNPTIFDVTDIENVDTGWTWNGESFIPPAGDDF